jgi:hypothetical protein
MPSGDINSRYARHTPSRILDIPKHKILRCRLTSPCVSSFSALVSSQPLPQPTPFADKCKFQKSLAPSLSPPTLAPFALSDSLLPTNTLLARVGGRESERARARATERGREILGSHSWSPPVTRHCTQYQSMHITPPPPFPFPSPPLFSSTNSSNNHPPPPLFRTSSTSKINPPAPPPILPW